MDKKTLPRGDDYSPVCPDCSADSRFAASWWSFVYQLANFEPFLFSDDQQFAAECFAALQADVGNCFLLVGSEIGVEI